MPARIRRSLLTMLGLSLLSTTLSMTLLTARGEAQQTGVPTPSIHAHTVRRLLIRNGTVI
jgi:hypothetical protein